MDSFPQSISLAIGAVAAWRLGEGPLVRPPRPDYIWPDADKTLHGIVTRTVSREDVDYLRTEARDLVPYLRAGRKAFLRTFLRDMRSRFDESSKVVRQFAADTDAPDLAFAALRQSIRFYALWFVLRTSLAFNVAGPAWRLTEKMFTGDRLASYRGNSNEAQASRL